MVGLVLLMLVLCGVVSTLDSVRVKRTAGEDYYYDETTGMPIDTEAYQFIKKDNELNKFRQDAINARSKKLSLGHVTTTDDEAATDKNAVVERMSYVRRRKSQQVSKGPKTQDSELSQEMIHRNVKKNPDYEYKDYLDMKHIKSVKKLKKDIRETTADAADSTDGNPEEGLEQDDFMAIAPIEESLDPFGRVNEDNEDVEPMTFAPRAAKDDPARVPIRQDEVIDFTIIMASPQVLPGLEVIWNGFMLTNKTAAISFQPIIFMSILILLNLMQRY